MKTILLALLAVVMFFVPWYNTTRRPGRSLALAMLSFLAVLAVLWLAGVGKGGGR